MAAVWFLPDRTTADIDLVSAEGSLEQRVRLMDVALAHGLSIETVNSAADFFLRRIPDWRDQLAVLRSGPKATIYPPTPTLFLLLKSGRLSEQDLQDCLSLLDFAHAESLRVDRGRVETALAALPATDDPALATRRAALRAALDA